MMINYSFSCLLGVDSLRVTGEEVLPARIITIGQLSFLCLGDKAIVYAYTLKMAACFEKAS